MNETIELPAKRILGVYECPGCGKTTVARTRYKVGSIDPTTDDVVNSAMPGRACPECGCEDNWALQEDPVGVDDDGLWMENLDGEISLSELYDQAGGEFPDDGTETE